MWKSVWCVCAHRSAASWVSSDAVTKPLPVRCYFNSSLLVCAVSHSWCAIITSAMRVTYTVHSQLKLLEESE